LSARWSISQMAIPWSKQIAKLFTQTSNKREKIHNEPFN